VEAVLRVNGERRDAAPVAEDFAATVATVARILAAVDERPKPGDRIITGSIVQVPVTRGDVVAAEIGGLGSVQASVA
jgi:2-keto-4-pentenoate hydratase